MEEFLASIDSLVKSMELADSLSSGNVFLDVYQDTDQALFSGLLTDPEVMAHVGGIKSPEAIEELFARARRAAFKNDHIWAIRRRSDQAYIGHAALFKSDLCNEGEREILFYLLKPFWGQGYASQAGKLILDFAREQDNLIRVWATVDSDHMGSTKTCEKIGMTFCRKGVDAEGEFLIFQHSLIPTSFDFKIREESEDDICAIQKVHNTAFKNHGEGQLVNLLRNANKFSSSMSLVAVSEGKLVGHILFSEIELKKSDGNKIKTAALAPMAVLPDFQRRGIGKKLIEHGLRNLKDLGYTAVLVLGDPKYYSQSGFSVSLASGIRSPYSGSHFMGLELSDGALIGCAGEAVYPKEFECVN